MRKKEQLSAALFILLLVLLTCGVVRLFALRFERGDVYPRYSSYRSDPKGTRALHEALERTHGITVTRHLRSYAHLPSGRNTTLFLFGMPGRAFCPETVLRQLEGFAVSGGRIVLCLTPGRHWLGAPPEPVPEKKKDDETSDDTDDESDCSDDRCSPPDESEPETGDEEPCPTCPARLAGMRLGSRWGFDLRALEGAKPDASEGEPKWLQALLQLDDARELPSSVDWHSGTGFVLKDDAWAPVYATEDTPVVIERALGDGTLVIASDSFQVSNEALLLDRHPGLLAWYVGGASHVIFEEAHLGVRETPGLVAVCRTYRLHGIVAGLLLLAALFIWKNSLPLVPPPPEPDTPSSQDIDGAKNAGAGLVSLLRRNIRRADVLNECFVCWCRQPQNASPRLGDKLSRMRAAMREDADRPTKEQNPTRTYNDMCKILAERK